MWHVCDIHVINIAGLHLDGSERRGAENKQLSWLVTSLCREEINNIKLFDCSGSSQHLHIPLLWRKKKSFSKLQGERGGGGGMPNFKDFMFKLRQAKNKAENKKLEIKKGLCDCTPATKMHMQSDNVLAIVWVSLFVY